MAKGPKPKKKAISIHSRAARRAGSPSVNIGVVSTDKSSITQSTTYTPYRVSSEASRGIRKRKSALSRNQKLRRKRGVERADATSAKVEIKKQKSVDKLKKVKARAKDWDDVNTKGTKKLNGTTNSFGVLGGMDLDGEGDGMGPAEQILTIRQPEIPVNASNENDQHSYKQIQADDDI